MTASSLDIFPCRVQLIGLPSSNNSHATTSTYIRPPIAKIRGISRNLFGSPDPSEMKNLYKQEAERIHSYVLQRYNIDTNALKHSNENECREQQPTEKIQTTQTTINCETQPIQMPTLIEQEIAQHRLGERHNLTTSFPESKQIREKVSKGNFKNAARICNEYSTSPSPAIPEQKYYKRQSSLKESFIIRKHGVHLKKSGQQSNTKAISFDNSEKLHRKPEFLQLSKQLNLQQTSCDIQEKETELPTCNNIFKEQLGKRAENKKRTKSCNDNCTTTLSLQLVVSTQDAS